MTNRIFGPARFGGMIPGLIVSPKPVGSSGSSNKLVGETGAHSSPAVSNQFQLAAAKKTTVPKDASSPRSIVRLLSEFGKVSEGNLSDENFLPVKQSFLDQVPKVYRERVVEMARIAFDKGMGGDLAFERFVEKMAQCWLLKKSEFERLAEESGYVQMEGALDRNCNASLLILTVSGSFVAVTMPDKDGLRDSAYVRIKLREPRSIAPFRTGMKIASKILVGHGVIIDGHIQSSPAIAVFASHADAEKVRVVTHSIVQSFIDVEHKTILGPDDEK